MITTTYDPETKEKKNPQVIHLKSLTILVKNLTIADNSRLSGRVKKRAKFVACC
jgi:hypothetical protein